ncbi:hypothetical protein BP6252_00036 [Coleophoma cylindrospora]|uniref:Uncharacterized protein n=1 Tax=Coleophoma cylindrospora TaxID=1849047 RepID=A0A3D8SP92_9HELO|nr:hypothetical protein BP6252_00036 [Coleophoma cylindrospora]
MLTKFFTLSAFLALVHLISYAKADCSSFGIDFQNGGSYFINSNDNTSFTSVTQFEGCVGTANVILEGPDSNSWLCSDSQYFQSRLFWSPLCITGRHKSDINLVQTPWFHASMHPELTCNFDSPIAKNQMYNGTWILVILDNNGDNPSFSAQRSFQLVVAPQQTTTYTPTVTVVSETTPSVTSTSTSTLTNTTTLTPATVTTIKTGKSTITSTPKAVTVYSTVITTRTMTKNSLSISLVWATKTATCSIPKKLSTPDPVPNQLILGIAQSLVARLTATSAKATTTKATTSPAVTKRSYPLDTRVDRGEFIGRNALARDLFKRAPDVPTLTVTDSNTADWVTTTSTHTNSAYTITVFTTVSTTVTVTPAPVTKTGTTQVTVTLPTPTSKLTTNLRTTTTIVKTTVKTFTVTTTTTPKSILATCSAKGGVIKV